MITIRQLQLGDLEFALALSTDAGWNQTRADWERFLRLQPDGCWLAEAHGERLGTVVVCSFGAVAWIAMMLVRADRRGAGIGRALMERALRCAEELGALSIRLDATPLGQPLYESLGFSADFSLTRYGGTSSHDLQDRLHLPPARTELAVELDAIASGVNRRKLIEALLTEQPGAGVSDGDKVFGFCSYRLGCRAVQIGPCITRDGADEAGRTLLRSMLALHAGQPVMLDIPDQNEAACAVARDVGLVPQRPLLRMTRGDKVHDVPASIWASSGGEKG